jgi:hypothetical protein
MMMSHAPNPQPTMASGLKDAHTPLHVEINGVFTQQIAPHIAPLQTKMKWFAITEMVLSTIILGSILFIGVFQCVNQFKLVTMVQQFGLISNPILLMLSIVAGASLLFGIGYNLHRTVTKALPSQGKLFEWLVGDDYQTLVITPLLKHLNPHLRIAPQAEFPQGLYKKAQLFLRSVDRYTGTELVTHQQHTNFQLGWVHSEYISRDSEGRSTHHTIFKGLLACLPCQKATEGKTFIFPDGSEKLLGGFAKQLQGLTEHAEAKLITMDNPEFEKQFKVYTTDTVAAHYLLSTKWLEKLTHFQRQVKVPLSIALHEGCCYVALHGYESPFKPMQSWEQSLTATGVYSQYVRLKKLFDELAILQKIGNSLNND